MDTLDRQLAMLRQLPRYPRRIDTVTLRAALINMGFDVSLRTIQRDLNQLSLNFPLAADDSKPQGWWWKKDAGVLDIPGLDPQTAMVFRMVEEHLKPLLPESTLAVLKPWFESASKTLKASGLPLTKWPNKIRILPKGMPLLAPEIDPIVQSTVYQALLDERWLQVNYRSRGANESRIHEVNPLAIVQRGSLVYLVATIGKYTNPVLLLLHRIESAELLDRAGGVLDNFNLDQFIADGELNYRLGPPIKLTVRFSKDAIAAVTETPLSEDQIIEALNDDWTQVSATVSNTHELRAWLRGFGREAIVMCPPDLI